MNPYFSFVVAARNDNYGGNFLHRMQVFVNVLLSLCNKYRLSSELVVVEWNPPPENPPLAEALSWPKDIGCVDVRFIVVPLDVHRKLPNSDRMPMFEYIAKNVGIRRAQGEFVLATNPDLIYSDALIASLASDRLSSDCFYRVDRYDVGAVVPLDTPVEGQLRYCSQHVIKLNKFYGTFNLADKHPLVEAIWSPFENVKESWVHFQARFFGRLQDRIHTNASGDFFLMARDHWHSLGGYPELPTHSFIDGYICFMAASMGLRQVIMGHPRRLYHQEHDRTEHRERPLSDYQQYRQQSIAMLQTGKPLVFNDENWGLRAEKLRERTIAK